MHYKNIIPSKRLQSLYKAALCSLSLFGITSPTGAWSQSFNQKLFIPDTLSTADHDTISLVIKETERVFFPGATTSVIPGFPAFAGDTLPVHTMSYTNPSVTNPGILGPTLVWWKGDSVTMSLENQLMDSTTTHWHGAHVAPYNDGGPHQVIPPQKTWKPSFKIRDDATTMWYHPHLHMMTMMQVNMGMAGLIMIKDKNDPFRNILPHQYGVDEFPIILQDKFFIQDTSMPLMHEKTSMPHDRIDTECSMGTTFLVNGTWQPYLNVPAQANRFRILNGSSERAYCLFLRDSTAHTWVPFSVIASDAGYLNKPYGMGIPPKQHGNMDSLLMIMSGERYEIVFDAKNLLDHDLYLMNMRNLMVGNDQVASFAGGPNLNDPGCYANLISKSGMLPDSSFDKTPLALMKIMVGASNGKPGSVPAEFLPYNIPDEQLAAVIRNKGLYNYNVDSATSPPFSIDSVNFDMKVINDTVYLGDTEVWNVSNNSGVAHPFHIHDIHFFITSITNLKGEKLNVPPYMRGPKDVAPVTDSSKFKLVMQFNDFATPIEAKYGYMYHCHILAHEDGGMMHQFVVTPNPIFTGLDDADKTAGLKVYPNPSQGELWVESNLTQKSTVKMYDLSAHLVKTWVLEAGSAKLDVMDLHDGVYLLEIETAEHRQVQRIAIGH